jgi:hypothetical protein
MDSALKQISQLPDNKAQVKAFARQLKDEILTNDKDPLKILVHLKFIEKLIEDVLKDDEIDLHFLNEFHQYGKEKVVEVNGAKLSEMEAGIRYDYSASGDPVWFDLDKQIKELAEKKKEREKFLQNLPYEGTVDPTTGVYVNRPAKSSKTKVKVTL